MSVRFPTRMLPRKLLTAALLVALSASATQAQTAVTWTQGATGNWNTTGNWTGLLSPNLFPNNTGGNTYTVTIPGVAGQANSTTVLFDNTTIAGNTITISGLTLASALNQFGNSSAELVLGAGVTLNAGNLSNFTGSTLSGGRYFLDGTFKFNGANVQTLGAGTTLVMNGAAAQILNQTNNANALAAFSVNNGTFDIRNGFNHGAANNFLNTGIISVSEGSTFYTSTNFTNSGTLLASGVSGAGNVNITNSTVDQSGGGILNAGDKGVYFINNSSINGGTLTSSGTGKFTFAFSGSNVLNGVTVSGNVDLASNQGATRVTNGLTFGAGGVINLDNNSVLSMTNSNTIGGTGSIVFGASGGNAVAIDVNSSVLTLGSGVTIRGQNGVIGSQYFNSSASTSLINNGLISADVSGGTITMAGAPVTNNNILEAKNGGTLLLSTDVTGSGTSQIRASNNGIVKVNGFAVTGGNINTSTGGRFTATFSGSNVLNGVTINGGVDLATTQGAIRIVNGAAFGGGDISVNNNSVLSLTGATNLTGTGSITFGNSGSGNLLALDLNNAATTIGSGVLVHGHSGTVGLQYFNSSANTSILNNGTISADVNGGTIGITQATVNNNNVLEAKNGGALVLSSVINNSGTGKMQASNNGVVTVSNATITGGSILTSGGGRFTATNSGLNTLNDVTVNGAIDLATSQGFLRVNGAAGMTLLSGSTVDINSNSVLSFQGNQTLNGAGSIVFGSSGASNQVAIDITNSQLTIGANASIRGHSGTIGTQSQFSTANASILNNGRISADVSGGTINIASAAVINNGTLEAKNGGRLMLSSNVTGNSGSQISAGSGSTVLQNGVTLSGVINSTGTGSLTSTNNANNFLDAVSLTGRLDLATSQASERVLNGLTLNGTVDINNNSVFAIHGTQNIGGNGSIILGNTGLGNKLAIDQNNSVVTLGANVKIRGENGTIGQQNYISSANTSLINNGRISADVAGGTIEMLSATVTNNGIMEALNGGTLKLSSAINGTSNGQFIAGAGSVVLQNGVSVSGIINSTGTGFFRATNSANNVLDNATVNGTVDLATTQASERVTNNLALNGNINVNNSSVVSFQGSQLLSGTGGTITLGNSAGNKVAVDFNNSDLTVAAGVLIHGENGSVGAQYYNSSANTSISNNGRISADVNGGTITLTQATFNNNGILDAQNGGTLNLMSTVANTASGKVNASNNSVVLMNGMTMSGGTINTTGNGAFRATFSSNNHMNDVTINGNLDLASQQGAIQVGGNGLTLGSGGVAHINGNSVMSFSGDVLLGGTGSVLFGNSGAGNMMALDISNSRLTVGQGVTVHGENGTIGNQYFNSSANTHLVNNGIINSDGGGLITLHTNLADIQNNGTLRAQNGALTLGQAVTGTGKLQVDAGGTLNMSGNGANTQHFLAMGAAGATLNTANQNITINKDYTNAAAGTGNTFNKRAGVNGSGQILAGGDAAQAITGGNVTGSANNYTMTIGNVRVGTTNFNYQIANTGTAGADLRGAIQTSVNGGNITDARLSGAGVTAGGYGPIAVATNSGNLAVGFTAATAGVLSPLSGQAVNLRSNFDNIADQKLNIALAGGAAAYNVAVGNTTAPVNLGNTRVGGTLSGNLNVSNTAPNSNFSEKLDAAFGANSGSVSNNGGAISLLSAGSSNNSTMGVSLSTATSGAKSGTATVNYSSNGTGTSGLATIAAGNQTVAVSGNVYAAAAGQLNSTPLNFGTVQVGQNVSKILSITNSGVGAAGFVEDLNASFGATSGTGSNLISGSGSIAGLLAGATNNNAMTVSVNTSAAGNVAGNILVNYISAGAVNGVSNGLGTLAVGNSLFGVNGNIQATANVVNQASPIINNAPINLGNVRVGSVSPTGFVSVTNQLTTAPQAALNASITGNGSVTASGSFNLLDPGATNTNGLQVGMNTATAGNKSGNATIGFVSDASNIGNCAPNCQLTLASQNVAVNGAVYRLANPTVSNAPINLVARVGDAAPVASIGITNNSPDIYTERLDAAFNGAAPTGFTTSGSITGLAAQGSSSALKAALNTTTAGVFSGNASIALTSSGAGTTGAADFALTPGSASLNGKVYAAAVGLVNTQTIDFGIVHVGDVVSAKNVSVSNSAAVAALNDKLTGDISGGNAKFGVSGTLGAGVDAGSTDNSNLNVSFNTSSAGSYNSTASVNLKSHNADMSDLSLGSTSVGLTGTVNNYASAAFTKSSGSGAFNFVNGGWVLDFGSVAANSSPLSTLLGVQNTANGPADDLGGSFMFGGASAFSLTGFSQFTGIGAGSIFGGLGVLFNTASLGQFSQTITLSSFGSNASGYIGNLSDLQLTVMGNVTSVTTPPITTAPEPSTFVLLIGGLGVVALARKHRNAR